MSVRPSLGEVTNNKNNMETIQKPTGKYIVLMVNLQQALVLSEQGTILATCSKHKNIIAYNKPLLCDASRRKDVIECLTQSHYIERPSLENNFKQPTLMQTDSFSIGVWNQSEHETTLL